VTNDLEQVLTAYESWLPKQPLAKKTQDAYRFYVEVLGLSRHQTYNRR
jgi:hypothetical protein